MLVEPRVYPTAEHDMVETAYHANANTVRSAHFESPKLTGARLSDPSSPTVCPEGCWPYSPMKAAANGSPVLVLHQCGLLL